MRILLAVDGGEGLAHGLLREGHEIVATHPARAIVDAVAAVSPDAQSVLSDVAEADAVVLEVRRDSLTAGVVALGDRVASRIVPLCAHDASARLALAFGLEQAVPSDVEAWCLSDILAAVPVVPAPAANGDDARDQRPRVVVVWGAAGAPGRTTVAIELAIELARGGRHVGLVDADTHAPSIAVVLGLADEGPGFAAACRQAELGGLDVRELARVSVPLGRTGVDVLTGLNRPSRWPELSETRVQRALEVARDWADYVVVDVAGSLERDEEIMSDLDAPRRNAATIGALRAADLVVAVAGADPVGVARFLRGHSELRATIGATPVAVLANRLRPGAMGIDARGQVRRTLDRFAGIREVWFLPQDPRSADAALLASQPIAEVAPRSAVTLALRRFVGEAVVPGRPVTDRPRASRRRRARSRSRAEGPAPSV